MALMYPNVSLHAIDVLQLTASQYIIRMICLLYSAVRYIHILLNVVLHVL
jgi:hypothetical protein